MNIQTSHCKLIWQQCQFNRDVRQFSFVLDSFIMRSPKKDYYRRCGGRWWYCWEKAELKTEVLKVLLISISKFSEILFWGQSSVCGKIFEFEKLKTFTDSCIPETVDRFHNSLHDLVFLNKNLEGIWKEAKMTVDSSANEVISRSSRKRNLPERLGL